MATLACGAGSGRAADKPVDFAKEIQPILQASCVKCHGPEKQKGKLRLDSKEVAMKGGKNGAVIVAKDAEKSELYKRVILPKGNEDIMPSEGDPLTKAQTDLIKDWINQGAEWPAEVAAKPADPKVAEAKPAAPKAEAKPVEVKLPDVKPTPAELEAIAKFEAAGVPIRPIAMNVGWREANFRLQGATVTDATIAPLKELNTLMELNLATTKITDAGLDSIKGLTNLTHLHLENTAITDAGLARLQNLKNLTYLNLYGTPVTDAGLESVKALTHLKQIYLWQTKVTDAGITNLHNAMTNLMISSGREFAELAKPVEKEKEKAKEEPKK